VRFKTALGFFFALFFVLAGIMHFVQDDVFAAIVPPLLPFPKLIVWVTGIMELILAVSLVLPKYRTISGLLFMPYLLAVLPPIFTWRWRISLWGEMAATPTALWIRAALQFPLTAIILWVSENFNKKTMGLPQITTLDTA